MSRLLAKLSLKNWSELSLRRFLLAHYLLQRQRGRKEKPRPGLPRHRHSPGRGSRLCRRPLELPFFPNHLQPAQEIQNKRTVPAFSKLSP